MREFLNIKNKEISMKKRDNLNFSFIKVVFFATIGIFLLSFIIAPGFILDYRTVGIGDMLYHNNTQANPNGVSINFTNNATDWYNGFNGSFNSLIFYNSTISYWNASLGSIDTYNRNFTGVTDNTKINTTYNGLIAYWKLDGNALDETGKNNGTNNGCTNTTGIASNAFSFNGNANYVAIPNEANFDLYQANNISISAWFKTADPARGIIFGKNEIGVGQGGYNLYISFGNIAYDIMNGGGTQGRRSATIGGGFNDNRWHHVVFTYNGTTATSGMIMYVDGVKRTLQFPLDTAVSDGTGTNNYNPAIGRKESGLAQFNFTGSIDEVAVWNITLNSSEARQIYESQLSRFNTNVSLQTRVANTYNITDINLVSYYGLNNDSSLLENATLFVDMKGTKNGTCLGATCPSFNNSGILGNAYDFTTSKLINITGITSVSNSSGSMNAWFKRKGNADAGSVELIFSSVNGSGGTDRYYLMTNASLQAQIRFANNNPISLGTIVNNQWYMITLTWNSTNYMGYLDGVLKTTQTGTIKFAPNNFSIGCFFTSTTGCFNGTIDEVRLYNKTLTNAEVTSLYDVSTYISDWSNWNSETLASGGISANTALPGKFMQYRANLYTNNTQSSPYLVNYSISNILDNLPPIVNLISPTNATIYNTLSATFLCNITDNFGIINLTLYIWNSTGLVGTNSTNLTGITNSSNFSFSVTRSGNYVWNCLGVDFSGNGGFALSNRTIFLDTINPNATLVTLVNNSYLNYSSNINLTANISDDSSGISNTTLYIYNSTSLVNQTTVNYTLGTLTSSVGVVVSLIDNVYTWFYNIFDWAGNNFLSENRTLTIDTIYPFINFTNPTPINGTIQNLNSIIINMTSSDANSVYSFVDFNVSLLSWFRFENSIDDSKGNNNGTCVGVGCPTSTTLGKFGGAYTFDSVNQYIDAGAANNLNFDNSSNFTISIWIKIKGLGSDGIGSTILGKANSSFKGYIFYVYNDSRGLYFQSDNTNITSNYQINQSIWYHIAYLQNSSGQYLFVNGNQVANSTLPSLSRTNGNFYIGTYTIPPTKLFNGTIDEVLIFNRSLSANEIKSLYDANVNQYYSTFNNLIQGSYTYIGYAIDSVGFLNSTETRKITINTANPNIYFDNPTETSGSYISRNNSVINVSANVSSGEIANITIYFYNSTQDLINLTLTLTFPNFVNITNLANGIYFFNATTFDNSLNSNSTVTRNVTIDTIYPLIDYNAGTLNSGVNISQNFVYVNVSVTETNEANITFRLYNSTGNVNTTTLSAGTRNINFTGLIDGTYTYNVTLMDLALNSNTTLTRTITLDRTAPNATLLSPSNASYLNNSNNNFTANLSDNTRIFNATLNIYNSTGPINQTVFSFASNTLTTTVGVVVNLVDSVYTWFYSIFDWAGNQFITENRTVTIDTTRSLISAIKPIAGTNFNISSVIEVSINISDATPISYITANISYPDLTSQVIVLSNSVGNKYNNSIIAPNLIGRLNISFFENDSAGNINQTETTYFIVRDNILPNATFIYPTPENGSTKGVNTTIFQLNIEDNIAVNSCILTLDGVNYTMNLFGFGIAAVCNLTINNMVNGTHNFFGIVNDSSGNINQSGLITYTIDIDVPNVNFVSPTETSSSYLAKSNISININATTGGTPISNITIKLFNSTRGLINQTTNASNNYAIIISGLENGVYYFNASAYDNLTRIGYTETRSVTLDTLKPLIDYGLNSANSETYTRATNIYLNVSLTEINEANITFSLHNSTSLVNLSVLSAGSRIINWTNLHDGFYTFNVTSYDLASNYNSTLTRNVTIDTTLPLIDYNSGTLNSGVNISQNFVYVNVSVTETNEANITFRLYNSTGNVNTTTLSAGTRNINFTGLIDGTYTYNVTLMDLALNSNITLTRIITLDRTAPNATLLSPSNASYLNNSNNNFTANLSDNTGISNATLNIYNSTDLVNQTIVEFASNTLTTTVGVVVNLVDSAYTWFYNIFDWAGNQFITENRTVSIDTVYPLISFESNTRADGVILSNTNLFINVSVTETNEANITFRLYNSTANVNTTTFAAGIRSINFTNLSDEVYSYNVSITDLAGNVNTTQTRTASLGINPPVINSINYYPNSIDEVDPNTPIRFRATISPIGVLNVSTVLLEYYDGSNWNNVTMVSLGSNSYEVNLTLASTEKNYTYFVFANDSAGNVRLNSNQSFVSSWDCSWIVTPTTLGAISGVDERKSLGSIVINNTGDSNFSNNNCSLDFKLTYNLALGRIYIDNYYYKPSDRYTLTAKTIRNISLEGVFFTDTATEDLVITADEITLRSVNSSINISGNLITASGNQPYLFQAISTQPTTTYLDRRNFSLSGYIRNLMGDGSVAKAAYSVSFNWTLPENFSVADGSAAVEYAYVSGSSANYNNINLSFDTNNLPRLSQGVYTIYLYGYGFNSTNDRIVMVGNQTLLINSINLTLLCSNVKDGIVVTACGSLDGDYVAPTTETATSASSGGGGGGAASSSGARLEKSEATYEILRGDKQTFTLEVKNKYETNLRNIAISVAGLNSEYISILPRNIDLLTPNSSRNITVTINAPAYFTGSNYTLIFDITGGLVSSDSGGTSSVSVTEKRRVTLYILEIPRELAKAYLINASEFIKIMNKSGMYTKEIEGLYQKELVAYSEINFLDVKTLYGEIKTIYDNAFESQKIIEELKIDMLEQERNGITTDETKKILALAQRAFARGDFTLALERLKEAKLTYALEVKGEFNLIYTIKNNPLQALGILLIVSIAGWGSSIFIRLGLYRKKLRLLGEEETLLLELMKMVQRQCFEQNRMSMDEYDQAMLQYETKLSETIEDKIRIETKIANLLKIKGKRKALDEEKQRLIQLIKSVQDDYLNKNKIETRVYENMLKSYSTRLTEVDEQLAYLDAEDAIGNNGKKLRIFKK